MCSSANTFKAWQKAISSSAAWNANTVAKRFARIMNASVLQHKQTEQEQSRRGSMSTTSERSWGESSSSHGNSQLLVWFGERRGNRPFGDDSANFRKRHNFVL